MSENLKGDSDTSSKSRIVKNPLLSASVTGLTFDDFPNKPLLLPAAPPAPVIVPAATPAQLSGNNKSGGRTRESKSLVTVGSTSDIDSENLDEINLNTSIDDTTQPALIETNANTLWEQNTTNADSILSQAASSFSALPSVASSVFSTFSKRIYSNNSSREHTPFTEQQDTNSNAISQLDIQPSYIQQHQGQQQQYQQPLQFEQHTPAAPPPTFFPPPPAALIFPPPLKPVQQSQGTTAPAPVPAPAEPPKFYTPSEISTLPTAPVVTAQNTYRLSAKKKIYAPVPGLSQDQTAPTLDTSAVAASISFNSSQTPTTQEYSFGGQQQYLPQQPIKQEDRKGGLFSLTNLVPTGVFHNLSGLVQTAAGTLAGTLPQESSQPQSQPPPPSHQYPTAISGGNINYFGGTDFQQYQSSAAPIAAVPPPLFYPSAAESLNQPTESSKFFAAPPPPISTPYQQPQQPINQNLPTATAFTGIENSLAGSEASSGLQPPPISGFFAQPSKSLTPEIIKPSSINVDGTAKPSVAIFDPTKDSSLSLGYTTHSGVATNPAEFIQPQLTIGLVEPIQPVQPLQTHQPNQTQPFYPTVIHSNIASTETFSTSVPASASLKIFNPVQQAGTTQTGTNFFGAPITQPTQQQPSSSADFNITNQQTVSLFNATLPPSIATVPLAENPAAPPPSAPPVSGQTSFRLQKGTRLYKSPLTSAETVPAPFSQPPFAQPPTQQLATEIPQAVFNPFASPTSTATVAPVAAPPSYFLPHTSEPQSVALFTAEKSEPQSVSLFPPEKSESQSVALFSPENPEPQSVGLLTPKLSDPRTSPLLTTEVSKTSTENSRKISEPNLFNPIEDLSAQGSKDTTESIDLFAGATEVKTNDFVDIFKPIEPVLELEPEDHQPITTESAIITNFTEQTIESVVPEEATRLTPVPSPQLSTSQKEDIDPLEQTLQKLSLESESNTNKPTPFPPVPPSMPLTLHSQPNPYRRESGTGLPSQQITVQPSLANFFTPALSDSAATGAAGDFNFFSTALKEPKIVPSPTSVPSAANFFSSDQSEALEATTVSQQILFEPSTAAVTAQHISFPPLPSLGRITLPEATSPELPVTELVELTSHLTSGLEPIPLDFVNLLASTEAQSQFLPADTQETATQETQIGNTSFQSEAAAVNTSVNLFSNYFNQTSNFPAIQQTQQAQSPEKQPALQQTTTHPDPTSFFDTFAPSAPPAPIAESSTAPGAADNQQSQQRAQANEDQRIQNFFNNPPPQENVGGAGDLNYDLVHRGLAIRTLQTRSLTPVSNIVEPPSSSCSEFSELNSSNPSAIQKFPASEGVLGRSPQRAPVAPSAFKPVEIKKHYEELPADILHELRMANLLIGDKGAASVPPTTMLYTPAVKHWFYKRPIGIKHFWTPFSHYDSALLETTMTMGDEAPNIVAVEGGRYDVNIRERTKAPVYWEGKPIEVRRCSWFYKGTDSKYVPYEEQTAELLEVEYKQAAESNEWHKKIILSMGEQVVFHGPTVIVHFQQQQNTDAWGGTSQTTNRPRVVKRDLDDFAIEQGESQRVDHLLLMVHGIGSACDLKLRSVEEVVDDFRSIAQQLVQSHYKNSTEMGLVGRVEVLPISWHSHLHSEELGIDEKLKSITLESIPKLRNFTNDTLLDVLFYTSPTYCQQIVNTVAASMNAVYRQYRERHPDFNGGVSLAGHSLGSLILFDLLCHQTPVKEQSEEQNMENPDQNILYPQVSSMDSNIVAAAAARNSDAVVAKQINYTMGHAGTGQPSINYQQLVFQPKKFFALGSPIGMFVTIRGIDKLGLDFRLPTCAGFYNIFHPFDPVAYRIEALVNPDMSGIRPVLIPHHKGRKRMHLELKETMTRVGADLKQRFFDTFKTTMDSVNFLGARSKREAEETMKKEVDKVIEMQIELEQQQKHLQQQQRDRDENDELISSPTSPTSSTQPISIQSQTRIRGDSISSTTHSDSEMVEIDFPLGKLNDSKRVDYVLQEAPLEFFNEYIFALSAHVCYWESEDTILFIMKEIYSGLGVSPDSQVPQQTMTIERPSSRNSLSNSLLSPTT